MNNIKQHIENVINHISKDYEVGTAIDYFVNFLKEIQVNYVVVGSTAIQSYLNFFHRIPGDFDIVLSEIEIEKIKKCSIGNSLLRFEEHPIASKLFFKENYYLHLIPEDMKIVDKITRNVFTRIDILHEERTEFKEIAFINFEKKIMVKVPTLEYIFCLNLFPQLDTHTIIDSIEILQKYKLNPVLINEFLERTPLMNSVVVNRYSKLIDILSLIRPELLINLPKLLD